MGRAKYDPLRAQSILRRHGIRPRKALGQHFVVRSDALRQIIDAAGLSGQETVLEIGAGLGALTAKLAEHAGRVIAVEVDQRLLPALRHTLEGIEAIELVVGDILELPWEALGLEGSYRVVANIPYSITSILIRRLLEAPRPPDRVVLTVQREVAERVNAQPGRMNLLALSVQIYGLPCITARISSRAFYPRPEVDSAVLRIDMHSEPVIPLKRLGAVFQLARAGFGQRRKQLRNSIAAGVGVSTDEAARWLQASAIDPRARAQELSITDWARLAEAAGGMDSQGASREPTSESR